MNAIQTLLTDHLDIWTAADTEKKSGRGRSSGNADRVYGIGKLRELILELAVRGKLVPQNANDEPASVLLKRIQAEKAKLIAEGKIKKDKPLAPITEDEKPFELPNGWLWTTLASLSLVNPRNNAEDNSPASFVPMTMIGTKFNSSHDQEARLWKEIKQGFTHFAEGDIGVAKITPCFENSKACVFSGLPSGIGAGTTELHIVRPINATLAPRYVLAYLKSPQFLLVGETRMTGTAGQKRLPKEFVESNLFPLPPLAEQHRIVAKIDELMALCDRLEQQQTHSLEAHQNLVEALLGTLTRVASQQEFNEAWARIASHFDTLFTTEASIDQLKQTLLQLAVMGKLTEKTDNWNVASLNDVCESIVDCPHSTPKFQLSGMVCIDTTCFKQGILQRDRMRYVSEESFHERNKRLYPRSGDIVFAREGSIGESVIIPDGVDACLGQRVMLLRPSHTMLSRYLRMAISSPSFLEQILHHHKGVGAKHINVKDVRSATIPLPSLAEQHRIVAKVDELMALCDTLKARLADAQAIQLHLADAIVEQAVC